jgi:hypothetical protein
VYKDDNIAEDNRVIVGMPSMLELIRKERVDAGIENP